MGNNTIKKLMKNKQTAVEWIYEAIDNELIDFLERRIDLNELSVAMLKAKVKALAMEKDQTTAFAKIWEAKMFDGSIDTVDDLYNKVYESDAFKEQMNMFKNWVNKEDKQ
jgi:hypothetical protein